MSNSVCIATYRCYDDKADFDKKAQGIAVGLTVGSWTELPEARKGRDGEAFGTRRLRYMSMSPRRRAW